MFKSHTTDSPPIRPTRILVVQTAFLGDVILTIPLLKALHRANPDARLDFLTIPSSRNLVETLPYIHRLWIYDKHGRERGIRSLWRLVSRLQKEHFDLALVPHRSLRSALMVAAARIPMRVGFHNSAGKWLFTHRVRYRRGIHEIDRNLELLQPVLVDRAKRIFPEIFFTETDHQVVNAWLAQQQISFDQNWITMAPGSVWATKRWPPEYYAEVARKLAAENVGTILIGGEGDARLAQWIVQRAGDRVKNAVGKFTLRQSALIIQKSRLLLTNDSAPLHMGVAVNTPVISIFGPTVTEFGFYPCGPLDEVIEIPELKCRPCGIHGGQKCPLGTHECMKRILPDRVFQRVMEKLTQILH
ncbi:MAG: lipopolysaccharide heptosyltransferase II [Calditrichaeota bacterium]|nr:lipopolysaccharide heptosyltransferase II [Calditrichota bacterium]